MPLEHRFEIVDFPNDPNEAARLTLHFNNQFASKGWEIVTAIPAGPALVLVLQKTS